MIYARKKIKTGSTATTIIASPGSIINAMTIPPMQRKGARITRRMSIAMKYCRLLTSTVVRFISDAAVYSSVCERERDIILSNRALRRLVP